MCVRERESEIKALHLDNYIHVRMGGGEMGRGKEERVTYLISMPLPATSVATRISLAPCFKLANAYSLQSGRE